MLKLEGKFEKAKYYIKRNWLVNNKEKYSNIISNLYINKKITKTNIKFVEEYNKWFKIFNNILPGVDLDKFHGIRVEIFYHYDKMKIKVSKYETDYVDLGEIID